jgi:hypothetical protein
MLPFGAIPKCPVAIPENSPAVAAANSQPAYDGLNSFVKIILSLIMRACV